MAQCYAHAPLTDRDRAGAGDTVCPCDETLPEVRWVNPALRVYGIVTCNDTDFYPKDEASPCFGCSPRRV